VSTYEPPPAAYEPEHRYQFEAGSPSGPHVVVSGSVNMHGALTGNEDEETANNYDVDLLVGPWWRNVQSVVPSVTITGYSNSNPDEDDYQAWYISALTWDTVGGTGPNVDEERIRLNFKVQIRGEHSGVGRIAYYLFARGRQLGLAGLNAPGPVHPNPS
jgi:hypothetical protein